MYTHSVHQNLNKLLKKSKLDLAGKDNQFYVRALANINSICSLYKEIYTSKSADIVFDQIITLLIDTHQARPKAMLDRDESKAEKGNWFLSNNITGMSLYVDRFCGSIKNLGGRLNYFEELGINFLHLMPIFESPVGESDGGYAVSNFRKVDKRFGNLTDLKALRKKMDNTNMYLMLDIVLNHTSHHHEWAIKAKDGDKYYQDFFYMFNDRKIPDEYDKTMPEIFPESSPGNFTYDEKSGKWVMSVFHNYQWDLNYTNPFVFKEMLANIFFYANLGVDVLRIDAPAFIWKSLGTTCQNLPQAHTLLRLIKLCLQVSTPGMAILGEAIVAPKEIMKYFGTGTYTARECDLAYNATHMALQWDMLASGDTRVMLSAQHDILQKPYGTSWITYTRCHDDIGLGYEDYMISQAGYSPFEHRSFLKNYYSGKFEGSEATGALFSSNPKTGDARISGTLASLCGLEKAVELNDSYKIQNAVRKILLMQGHSMLLGGIPMLFYGDELGYTNDYSYLEDDGKSYDNRWMHRPVIDWSRLNKLKDKGSIEYLIYTGTKKLINIRKVLPQLADLKNLTWLNTQNNSVAGYIRTLEEKRVYCIFNFSNRPTNIICQVFNEHGAKPERLIDHWSGHEIEIKSAQEKITIDPYQIIIAEPI